MHNYKAYVKAVKAYVASMAETHTSGEQNNQEHTCITNEERPRAVQKWYIYIGIDVIGLTVMGKALENTLEHLGKDTRNI